ncbi:MAG: hypothetical protein ASARMPREDX12_006255 [Alectoria sarmentosa]|nr:MAG: hypothetical protein ASARMPREDX12_006255 [Alectoria sarmentosa]
MSSALPYLAEAMDPRSEEQDEENSEAESVDSFNSYEYVRWEAASRLWTTVPVPDFSALAPHVHTILGVDSALNMTIEYNRIAEQTEDEHPICEMRAMWADLIQGQEPVEDETWASDVEFDLIAMSLAINFFACPCCGIPGLQNALRTMTSRFNHNGTHLILDIQKDDTTTHEIEESDNRIQTLRNGKKITGCGLERRG